MGQLAVLFRHVLNSLEPVSLSVLLAVGLSVAHIADVSTIVLVLSLVVILVEVTGLAAVESLLVMVLMGW